MLPKLVGLTGRKQSGKDTAAEAICRTYDVYPFSFAAPLKIMLGALMDYQGVSEDDIMAMLHGDQKEVESPALAGRTCRHAMQTLGTEWGRQLMGDRIWVDICLRMALAAPVAVITDVRFPNEVDAIREAGGQIWKIERPGLEANQYSDHPSELYIDQLVADRTFYNAASSAELFGQYVCDTIRLDIR